jgi:hypothetical protein
MCSNSFRMLAENRLAPHFHVVSDGILICNLCSGNDVVP